MPWLPEPAGHHLDTSHQAGNTEIQVGGKISGEQTAWGHPGATQRKVAQSSQTSSDEGTLAWLLDGHLSKITPPDETQGPYTQSMFPQKTTPCLEEVLPELQWGK